MDRPKNKSKKLNIDGSKMKGRKAESKRQKTKDKKQKTKNKKQKKRRRRRETKLLVYTYTGPSDPAMARASEAERWLGAKQRGDD